MITMICPQCFALVNAELKAPGATCPYCGTGVQNTTYLYNNLVLDSMPLSPAFPQSGINYPGRPNMIVRYSSPNPGVRMVFRIVQAGKVFIFSDGDTIPFRLFPLNYQLAIKIGRRNYHRWITIADSDIPATYYMSWDPRHGAQIVRNNIAAENMNQQFRVPEPGARQCVRCGAQNSPNAAFCINCGNRF